MTESRIQYRSYLLRLWLVEDDGVRVWRVSLQNPGVGQPVEYDTLAQLCSFLRGIEEGETAVSPSSKAMLSSPSDPQT